MIIHLKLVFWDEVKLHLNNVSMLSLARMGKLSLWGLLPIDGRLVGEKL